MKKISFTLFLLFVNSLLAIVFVFYSCNTKEYRAVFTSINVGIKDDSKPAEGVNNFDTCSFESTAVGLKFYYQILNAQITPRLGYAAYALQIAERQTRITERIRDIRVISLQDYNATILAGDDISSKVSWQIDRIGNGQESETMSKNDFLNRICGQMMGDNSNNYRIGGFRFDEIPYFGTKQQFAIEVELFGGTRLQDTTIAFVLRP